MGRFGTGCRDEGCFTPPQTHIPLGSSLPMCRRNKVSLTREPNSIGTPFQMERVLMKEVLLETHLPFPTYRKGKVRDVYDLGDRLLIVATDRISAFDIVLPTGIPGKGRILNQLSAFWFKKTEHLCPNHVIATEGPEIPQEVQERSLLVRKTNPFPVECVVRGFLTGSAWRTYREIPPRNGIVSLWGLKLPAGLKEAERLPEPLFTPTTKAHTGHDESITFEQMVDRLGTDVAHTLREKTLQVYLAGCAHAEKQGFLIADTKMEFGEIDGQIILIDELLTPDSSRFWDSSQYTPGKPQEAYDKQVVRDYLQSLVDQRKWNKEPPGPPLPEEIVELTRQRYEEVFERLTG